MNEYWTTLVEQEIKTAEPEIKFWNGVDVFINRPHILNRKLLGTEIISSFTVPYHEINCDTDIEGEEFQYFLNSLFTNQNLNQYLNAECDLKQGSDEENNAYQIVLRKLIPRNTHKFTEVLEAVIKDTKSNSVIFWPKEADVLNSSISPPFPFKIMHSDTNRIVIMTYSKNMKFNVTEQASKDWLKCSVLPKIVNWCINSPSENVLPSLSLVSSKSYSINYNYLKEKYGKKYVEIWPECSDPLKYVYEDVGIAAYLMTFWEKEREDLKLPTKQSFVDLGCGNGLLVDILASEGYAGIGIDVRKRKIWDLYGKHTVLVEKCIEPSNYNLFPNYDWIIGNHSDELTPWIPVIAARSSYTMKVFLLPCCAYTFNGKYKRSSPDKTQYQSYLTFIHSLCESVGFNVQEDKLRIPSTKRLCFLCTSRNYKEEEEKNIDLKRKELIEMYCVKVNETSSSGNVENEFENNNLDIKHTVSDIQKETNWIDNFKPRESVELVKNCSQLDQKFLQNTVLTVANILLKTENYISLQKGPKAILWNAGGKEKLGDLIGLLDTEILKTMKNQCGGFQTFLRNHRNVFQISDGYVQLTIPIKGIPLNSKPASKRKRCGKKEYHFQQKPCFFFHHHPQGCPLETPDCNFSHKTTDNNPST